MKKLLGLMLLAMVLGGTYSCEKNNDSAVYDGTDMHAGADANCDGCVVIPDRRDD